MAGQHYCLRWNNYQSNMTSVFHQLLQTEAFVDVTLACNEASLKAHKVVLSACSSYFQKLLLSNPCKHPTIIMPQDVCFNDLKFIIEFVYRGEIDVSQAELQMQTRREMMGGEELRWNTRRETRRRVTEKKKKKKKKKKMLQKGKESERQCRTERNKRIRASSVDFRHAVSTVACIRAA
ncbi:broad-complex core protein isoforms 1/2/3/4/5-like isoform X3 [Frieseomelitta varia]|nr:broad-complex core protein isoforms 1/2/3/4/5-like isoform X3 [Frieseomelitta varia]XP_043527283.1 broad-complex core protein isoforms 1/2/3/4/5-like isoform X3 [Frieseomelitta varia]XP_043527284.1 broad-complex core protein isoforms 1/2/3/4/5-like isoform X3 [Frieseomelitta varia]